MLFGALSKSSEFTSLEENRLNLLFTNVNWSDASAIDFNYKQLKITILSDTRLPDFDKSNWFVDEKKQIAVLVNGSIYNSNELSNQPIAQYICSNYAEQGASLYDSLNGDFSIIIADLKKNEISFVKDHLGVRPLSFADTNEAIYFSTDTLGMSKGLFNDKPISHEYIVSQFYHFEENFSFTPNINVVKVLPGHFAEVKNQSITQKKYWFPENIHKKRDNYDQIIKELSELVQNSVEIRSDHQYTAGAHISGGLDSCLVAALSRANYPSQKKFFGFTWSPDKEFKPNELRFDERELMKEQCEKSDIHLIHSNFTHKDYRDHAYEWRARSESQFEKNIQLKANENKTNLIFSGWGGDEFISMGKPYLAYDLFWRGKWKTYLNLHPLRRKKAFLKALIGNVLFPSKVIAYLKYKTAPFLYKYMQKGMPTNKLDHIDRSTYTNRRGIHLGLIDYKHLAQRCEDWYTKGQRNGIEYRYPLMDKNIVEYVLSIPSEFFVKNGLDRNLIRAIGKEWLTESIRLLPAKGDPALGKVYKKILWEVNLEFSNELSEYRENKYFDFFDFDLLQKDIDIALNKDGELTKELILVLPYLKRVNEFTKAYHDQ